MDLRLSLNAISDVIVNRPPPLREFDQIYMKAADMLIQADHVSRWLQDREVIFVGDGDAVALCLMHLKAQEHLKLGPRKVHVLDFDERVVNSIARFAEHHGYAEIISASLYNVADPLPAEFRSRFDAFYTNPPFGGSNGGLSVRAFLKRGIEACREGSVCCAVLADFKELPWCDQVLSDAQRTLLDAGFLVAEMIPAMHGYHLDDEPSLTSCSLVARHRPELKALSTASSEPLPSEWRDNFYGDRAPLSIRYVRDLTNGGKLVSRDHYNEPFEDKRS